MEKMERSHVARMSTTPGDVKSYARQHFVFKVLRYNHNNRPEATLSTGGIMRVQDQRNGRGCVSSFWIQMKWAVIPSQSTGKKMLDVCKKMLDVFLWWFISVLVLKTELMMLEFMSSVVNYCRSVGEIIKFICCKQTFIMNMSLFEALF